MAEDVEVDLDTFFSRCTSNDNFLAGWTSEFLRPRSIRGMLILHLLVTKGHPRFSKVQAISSGGAEWATAGQRGLVGKLSLPRSKTLFLRRALMDYWRV